MSTTPNLKLPHIHANQAQKEVTANQFADGLDTAIAGIMTIDLSEKTEYTLTMREACHAILIFKGMLKASITITIPTQSANKKFIVAHHCEGDFALQFQHADTSAVIFQPQQSRWIFSNGEQLFSL